MSDPRGNWEQVETVDDLVRFQRVVYGDGIWVALATYGNVSYIATATSADGPWTNYGSIGLFEINELYYADGYWVVGPALATATDPADAWTENTSLPEGWSVANVAFGNGQWGAAKDDGGIYTATVPSGSWTLETTVTVSGQEVYGVSRLAYLDGEWVVVINTSPDGLCRVLTASDLDGPWTQQASFSDVPGDTLYPSNIQLTDEGYFIQFYYTVWHAPTLDGTWTKINEQVDWVAYGDGQYVWTQFGDIYVSDTIDGTREDQDANGVDYIWASVYADDTWVAVGESGVSPGGAAVWVAGEGGDGWGLLL